MIRSHPARVLGVTALVVVAFLALSYPGRDDTKGFWYYASAVGWFGFLISLLALIVLSVLALVSRARSTRRA
jgi:hypothetical protein